jgi:ATP-dependent RNA helicase DeaD
VTSFFAHSSRAISFFKHVQCVTPCIILMNNFEQFSLDPEILEALKRAGYTEPTPIQAATLPIAIAGKDILGCAQTGTGKTAAFLIPLMMHLRKNPEEYGLVLAPTREIAIQICESARSLARFATDLHGCVLIGGSPMMMQIRNLQRGPKLIIGTPGRVFDHLSRGTLNLKNCKFAVLDEADQMLDMGFAPQIEKVLGQTSRDRQTLMFSATVPPAIEKLTMKYLRKPERISVGQREKAVDTLKQKVIVTTPAQKDEALRDEIKNRQGSILVFTQTQWKADQLSYRLQEEGFNANAIHGGLSQQQRFNALRRFKSGQISILVATDVASRGLHIDNISHVINYELPTCSEAFLHRIGRTARNGKDGEAVTLVDNNDYFAFRRIEPYLKNCEIVGEFIRRGGKSAGGGARGGSRGGGSRSGSGGFNRFNKKSHRKGPGNDSRSFEAPRSGPTGPRSRPSYNAGPRFSAN